MQQTMTRVQADREFTLDVANTWSQSIFPRHPIGKLVLRRILKITLRGLSRLVVPSLFNIGTDDTLARFRTVPIDPTLLTPSSKHNVANFQRAGATSFLS